MMHLNGLEARMNVPWQIVIASADLEDRRTMVNILEKQELIRLLRPASPIATRAWPREMWD